MQIIKEIKDCIKEIQYHENLVKNITDTKLDKLVTEDLANLVIMNTLSKSDPKINFKCYSYSNETVQIYLSISVDIDFFIDDVNVGEYIFWNSFEDLIEKSISKLLNKEYSDGEYKMLTFDIDDYYKLADKFGIDVKPKLKQSIEKDKNSLLNYLLRLNEGVIKISNILNELENE